MAELQKKATRESYGETLRDLAEKYPERIFKINALQDEQKVTAEIMRVINTTIKI